MSQRLWDRADEFANYAPCANEIDFIIPPKELGRRRTAAVKAICGGCPVRPECIELNVAPVLTTDLQKVAPRPSSSIWVAGVWLTDPFTAASRRTLEKARSGLVASVPRERANRPDTLL